MAFTATHDGNGRVRLYGGTATHDGNGRVILTMDAVVGELGEAIASAQITVSKVAEVEGVWRYYKLQSSTLNAPSVPLFNPPEGWQDTEPTFTSDTTSSLYFVDLTLLSDGSWSYSNVSLSSSYEAAKEAYNAAVAAGNAANDANDKANELEETINSNIVSIEALVEITDSVTTTITTIEEKTDSLETDLSAEITKRDTIIRDTAEGVEIGKRVDDIPDPFSVLLTNEKLSFRETNYEVASISNRKLDITEAEIDNANVTGSLRFGNFAWSARANGNMGLRWVGGE